MVDRDCLHSFICVPHLDVKSSWSQVNFESLNSKQQEEQDENIKKEEKTGTCCALGRQIDFPVLFTYTLYRYTMFLHFLL